MATSAAALLVLPLALIGLEAFAPDATLLCLALFLALMVFRARAVASAVLQRSPVALLIAVAMFRYQPPLLASSAQRCTLRLHTRAIVR